MKKAALTFGLFSLIMVATSFATPEKTNKSIAGNIDIMIGADGTGGQAGRNGKKSDLYDTPSQINSNASSLNSFSSDSQLTKSRVKID
ncbi:hypothetical protein [Flavobacterium pectinovorum]|jgi:hypothetical protein|uniref:Pectate lyase n=1 Tax=Flavobacterium pectinovorum TaxID=29533 RepID=A0A502EAC5_9FLAO|nr:hypothetical protein [Flavobacterium pectinovorum]TPG33430.1 hypothetical protein EAH81_24245 [Flavobacterium pectinovorum]